MPKPHPCAPVEVKKAVFQEFSRGTEHTTRPSSSLSAGRSWAGFGWEAPPRLPPPVREDEMEAIEVSYFSYELDIKLTWALRAVAHHFTDR